MTDPWAEKAAARLRSKLDVRDVTKRPWAVSGYQRSDLTYSAIGDTAHDDALPTDQIYMRKFGNENDVIVVNAVGYSQLVNNTFWLDELPNNQWDIYSIRADHQRQAFGAQASQALVGPIRYDTRPEVVIGPINTLEGKLTVVSGLQLTVQPFPYTDTAGVEKVFDPSAFTVTVTPPAAVAGVNQKQYQRLSFNPTAGAEALVMTPMATSVASSLDLYQSDADTITTPAGNIPLWDIIVVTGDTTLRPYVPTPPSWINRQQRVSSSSPAVPGAPSTATYITQTPNATLSAEQALSALTTGVLKNTTATGVLSIAVAETDYVTPSGAGTLANKTLTTPTIASLANANHTHQNSAGGGTLDAAAIASGTLNKSRIPFAAPDDLGTTTPAQVMSTFLGVKAVTTVVIASGALTATQSNIRVQSETGTSDDLDTLNGLADGQFFMLTPLSAHTISVTQAGNIISPTGATIVLSSTSQVLFGQYKASISKAVIFAGYPPPGSAFYQTIQGNGSAVTQESIIDFIDGTNTTVAVTDDGAGTRTKVAISASLAGTGIPVSLLINGSFNFAQRQAPGTLTTITIDKYSADRWRVSRENTDIQYQRNDATGETGLTSLNYGLFKKITSTGKMMMYQIVEGANSVPLRSRTVTFQCKIKVDTARTLRIGLIELQNAGTLDTIPGTFVTAYGANTVDPTLGANLAYIGTPSNVAATTSWTLFSFSVAIPSNSKNVVVAVWTDSQVVANSTISMAEAQLVDGSTTVAWLPVSIDDELEKCQRYYETSYGDNPPGTAGDSGYAVNRMAAATTGNFQLTVFYRVVKRTLPGAVLYDDAGTINKVFRGASGKAATVNNNAARSFQVLCTDATSANGLIFHWLADAEL